MSVPFPAAFDRGGVQAHPVADEHRSGSAALDIDLTPEQQALRHEMGGFLASALPSALSKKVRTGAKVGKDEHVAWQRILAAKGWLAPSWDARYGGPGWGPVERFLWDEESHLAGMPRANVPALDLLGPLLIEFGTDEQKRRFLPPILASEDWWCQGFSEPNAGSDLASLTTRAVRDGDDYVINGAKTWTSYGHDANWMFALCRTSVEQRKQAGISFILLPMDDPGVTLSPILTLGGIHAVNSVTLEDVRVPVANRIGPEGGAWKMTTFLLGFERLVGAGLGPAGSFVREIKRLAARETRDGGRYLDDPAFRDRLSAAEIDLMALKLTGYRVLADELAGNAPGPVVSLLKVKGSEVQQSLTELLMEVAGDAATIDPLSLDSLHDDIVPHDLEWLSRQYMDRRKLTIYGGSAEIQRNIIAQRILKV